MEEENPLITFHNDGTVSVHYPELRSCGMSRISDTPWHFVRLAVESESDSGDLYVLLESNRLKDIYYALAIINKKKLSDFLPRIYELALYSENLCLRAEAISTIHSIGGEKAKQILRELRTDENRELIDELIAQ